MDREIGITAEPVDNHRCKFSVGVPVYEGVRRFTSASAAQDSPLVAAIFAIPGAGVSEVLVAGSQVTVSKDNETPWQAIGKPIGAAIRAALTSGVPPIAPEFARPGATRAGDDELYERVHDLFETMVNPMVARHGGQVELIDVQDAVVMLRMGGGCQGCGMASVTLRQGIEGMMNQHLPEVKGIVDITDHAQGANPYFESAKK